MGKSSGLSRADTPVGWMAISRILRSKKGYLLWEGPEWVQRGGGVQCDQGGGGRVSVTSAAVTWKNVLAEGRAGADILRQVSAGHDGGARRPGGLEPSEQKGRAAGEEREEEERETRWCGASGSIPSICFVFWGSWWRVLRQ